jgi:transposase
MVNIETGRIVDMIYSRESAEVATWLKTYPNIGVVSRDGSQMYAKAVSTAHPAALQVSDRFHLIKGLTDAARQYITGIIASRIRIESDIIKESSNYWDKKGRGKTDLPERLHNATTEKRAAKVQRVRELAAKGLTIVDKLKAYTETIDEMLTKRKKFWEIEEAIRSLGYAGAASTIRMYATRKRRHDQAAHGKTVANTEVVERKWLLKLLYHPLEKVKGITEGQLEKVMRAYPALATVYHIVRSFKEVVFAKQADGLEAWMESAKRLDSEEITGFVNGLSRDMAAVKNAIVYDYNNGLAEGSINKIKLYKRIMYGRNSFELLRCKTLWLEQRRRGRVNYLWKDPINIIYSLSGKASKPCCNTSIAFTTSPNPIYALAAPVYPRGFIGSISITFKNCTSACS